MSRFIFVLSMTPEPETTVEVGTSDVVQAIEAAEAALPHLGASAADRPHAEVTALGIAYTHTCLLCGCVNPRQQGCTLLVSMQEHLLVEHGVTIAEQACASRVFAGTSLQGCYIWCSPRHGAYFRASRYAPADPSEGVAPRCLFSVPNIPEQARQERLLLLSPLKGPAVLVDVQLAGVDEHAWYGFASGANRAAILRIWPKSRWSALLVDNVFSSSITLQMLKKHHHLTYAQLSEAMGMSSSRVRAIIQGEQTKTITLETLDCLARVLGISVPACIAAMEVSYRAYCNKYYILVRERDPLARFKHK